ncbi:MAG TPA: hypothetical protein VM841_03670 [Actinomycetota bacterium]|nr:hypothetical protein [Actinomycetota bacterium]
MFVQIIRAKVADADGINSAWQEQRDATAEGFLGATGGITTKGELLIAARFENRELAMKNSASEEQTARWNQLEKMLAGPAEFLESEDVDMPKEGSGDAGFVQMMRATVKDRKAYEAIEEKFDQFAGLRPDLIGHMTVWLPGNRIHIVDWFTTEAEARAGEKKEMPAEMQALFAEWQSLCSDVEWFDISAPLYA